MGDSCGQLSIHFVHKISFFLNFLLIRVFSWPDFMICHVEYVLACHILISEKKIVSVMTQVEKHEYVMYKTYGELSTTCHHFEYRPLVIARFQRAVTSLFFA